MMTRERNSFRWILLCKSRSCLREHWLDLETQPQCFVNVWDRLYKVKKLLKGWPQWVVWVVVVVVNLSTDLGKEIGTAAFAMICSSQGMINADPVAHPVLWQTLVKFPNSMRSSG
jgi:hypothetical protein